MNFAFAVDENTTQSLSDIDDDVLELENNPEDTLNNASEDVLAVETGYANEEDIKTIEMGKSLKGITALLNTGLPFLMQMVLP